MLKTFLSIMLMSVMVFGLLISDAEAKRFGGGRSFGMQRSNTSYSRAAAPANSFGRQAIAPKPNRWLGPLAGLVAGGLLASLFMGHGIGSGILTWLALGAIILLLIKMLKPKSEMVQTNNQSSNNPFTFQNRNQAQSSNYWDSGAASNFTEPHNQPNHQAQYPIGFDVDNFLRDAKVSFNRLQAAYDKGDLQDIRDFTTPEVTAEVQLQLQERGNTVNQTDVMKLEAELLDAKEEAQRIGGTELQMMVASVRFSGLIQEERNQPAQNFNEVWHFRKDVGSLKWVVAGIQQE